MTNADELRARLEASRTALLEAMRGLTERDFTTPLSEAETVIQALAGLAPGEREAVRAAREAAGAEPRPLPGGDAARGRPLPPQVVHDLAGARYETLLFLGWLVDREAPTPAPEAEALLAGIATREAEVARRIAARGGAEGPGAPSA